MYKRQALEAEKQNALEAEKQSVAEFFKNGVSLEVVLKSMKTLDKETIQAIYREVMGDCDT